MAKRLIDVSHVSVKDGKSIRITVPQSVAEILNLRHRDIIGYYEENGNVVISRINQD